MIRTRRNDTAAEVATQDDRQGAEAVAEPEIVPDDLATAAIEDREAAEAAAELAIQRRAEAEAVVSAARADADERIRQGHAAALPLIADANALERKAASLGDRGRDLKEAAKREAVMVERETQTANLIKELEQSAETITGLDGRISHLDAERGRLEALLTAARSDGDVSQIADFRSQLEATAEAAEALGRQRMAARTRADQAATELADALAAAQAHRAALTKALDDLYPDRPGAAHRRAMADLKNALEGNLERIAEEAKSEPGRRRLGYAGSH